MAEIKIESGSDVAHRENLSENRIENSQISHIYSIMLSIELFTELNTRSSLTNLKT